MIESQVILCLNQVFKEKPYSYLVESQNAVHPMDKIFGIVGTINEYELGTPTKTLTSRDGVWLMQQSVAYDVRIGIQGRKSDDVSALVRNLVMQMKLPSVRQIFMDAGYTYSIDTRVTPMTYHLNTEQYVRYSFMVRFKTSIPTLFNQATMEAVEVSGEIRDDAGNVVGSYEEEIKSS